jgi:hypothetical protein
MSVFTRDKVWFSADKKNYIGWDDAVRTNVVRIDGVSYPLVARPGTMFFVDSVTGDDGNAGRAPSNALATLDAAIGKCTANKGDVIIVMPNHAETVTGASGITFDVAGVTVIGLGHGAQRPRFLMDGGTTVTAVISAADVSLENLVFSGGHNGIVTCFGVTGVNARFTAIEFEDNTTDEHFLVAIKATGAANTADGLTVERCRWYSVDAGITDFISIIDDIANLKVWDNEMIVDAATGAGLILCATGKDILGLSCLRNVLICGNTAGDLLIDNDTAVNTGVVGFNLVGHHDTASAILVDCDGVRQFENYSTAADTASGVLLPAADDDSL